MTLKKSAIYVNTDSGVCTVLHNGHVQQHMLGDAPLMVTVTAATAAGRDPSSGLGRPPVRTSHPQLSDRLSEWTHWS